MSYQCFAIRIFLFHPSTPLFPRLLIFSNQIVYFSFSISSGLIEICDYEDPKKGNHPANIYLFKVKNGSTRKNCEICSKLTVKTPERRH